MDPVSIAMAIISAISTAIQAAESAGGNIGNALSARDMSQLSRYKAKVLQIANDKTKSLNTRLALLQQQVGQLQNYKALGIDSRVWSKIDDNIQKAIRESSQVQNQINTINSAAEQEVENMNARATDRGYGMARIGSGLNRIIQGKDPNLYSKGDLESFSKKLDLPMG